MKTDTLRFSLNAGQRSTLAALVRTVLPQMSGGTVSPNQLVMLIEDRLRQAPPQVLEDLSRAIDVFGGWAGSLLASGIPVRFDKLSSARQSRAFAAWGTSVFPLARTVHQALRRLILTTWYSTDQARSDLGVHPPLHTRSPAVDWEGPLLGDVTPNFEVVASATSVAEVPRSQPTPRRIPAGVTRAGELSGDVTLNADVVVIGSGAGGAVAAARFAEAGREVVIIEEGEFLEAPDFNEQERDMVPRLFADQGMRATDDAAISILQGGAAGGGTTVNWMLMLRPLDHVLEEWGQRFHLHGFSSADFGPHLDRVAEEVHAGAVPQEAKSPSNLAILRGARVLGWRARTAPINARGCVRAGTCSLGCRYDAKQSALLTYLPRAFSAGARLFAGCSVSRIELRHGGPVPNKRVHAAMRDPRTGAPRGRLTIDASIVVLAAGAVGTPVILERSGLGGGGVGNYLRLHPTTAVMGLYEHETYPLAGIPQSGLCDEFIKRDEDGYGFWIECPAFLPALASAALPGFGTGHQHLMQQLHRTMPFIVLVRDGSGTDASLGSVRVSRTGRVRIRHRLSAADRDNLQRGIEAAARLELAAGATEVATLHTPSIRATNESGLRAMRNASVAPNRVALFSAHVNGTCRLGVNPSTSGCSPTGERHGVRGLYVMDGSLFPTAPGVNPQWTIMAMSSLLASRALA